MTDYHHLRRLYVDQPLQGSIILTDNQHHYLRNVMRAVAGDMIRVFHVKQGEFLAEITEVRKKEILAVIKEQLRPAALLTGRLTLIMPYIHKDRMQFLIEKATELGMTHFQPISCERSENHKVREDKVEAWFIEAAEQCERLDIPVLLPVIPLRKAVMGSDTIMAAVERGAKTKPMISVLAEMEAIEGASFLVGPAGGFTADEAAYLQAQENIQPVSLGETILRAETAAIYGLSVINASKVSR